MSLAVKSLKKPKIFACLSLQGGMEDLGDLGALKLGLVVGWNEQGGRTPKDRW